MWSKTKKQLESLLCDSLKGRVQYFVTKYRESHDSTGRACILVDKKEMYNVSCLLHDVKMYDIEQELINDPAYTPKYESKYSSSWEAREIAKDEGVRCTCDFMHQVYKHFHAPILDSLNSDEDITVILALLDRRVGKRTLKKLKGSINEMSEAVQYFYNLRCEAEGIS